MKYIVFLCCFLLSIRAEAGSITRMEQIPQTPKAEINEVNGIAPEKIVQFQRANNAHIRYMKEHYSTEQMAQYAIRLNKSDRQAAMAAGKEPPEKLSADTLQDKEKIAEYLRSRFEWSY